VREFNAVMSAIASSQSKQKPVQVAVEKSTRKENDMLYCDHCEKEFQEEEAVIQVRRGYIEVGDFLPDYDLAYYHPNCFEATTNVVPVHLKSRES